MAKLKMTDIHYEVLKSDFKALSEKKDMSHIKDQYEKAGHTDLRFRWDMFWYLKNSAWVCRELYPYLTDDHIDSAIVKIFKELDI